MFPQHVWKGKKMPGRMGNEQVTLHGITVVDILPETNTVLVKGAVPGSRGSIVSLSS
jgi:large subunit ribosomal protein L3